MIPRYEGEPFVRTRPPAGRRSIPALAATAAAFAAALAGPSSALAADPCPNAEIRAQQKSQHLPGCRAWEQVSPVEKGGYSVVFAGSTQLGVTQVARDGSAATFTSWGTWAGTVGVPASHLSERTEQGWTTRRVSPLPTVTHRQVGAGAEMKSTWMRASRDLRTGFLITLDYFDPTDVNGRYDVYGRHSDGSVELLSRGNGSERLVAGVSSTETAAIPAASDDGSHVVFPTSDHLVPGDADRVAGQDLYERFGGHTYLVNQTTGGELINRCGSEVSVGARRAMSADGSRVIFQVPNMNNTGHPDCDLPGQLYMRVERAQTIHISASRRTIPATTATAHFVGAAADGSVVYFLSSEPLMDEVSAGGLYRYTVADDGLELVVPESIAPISHVLKVSADGSRAFFMSNLVAAPGAIFGAYNIYSYSAVDQQVRLVAVDQTAATTGTGGVSGNENLRPVVASPDGKFLIMAVQGDLTDYGTEDPQGVSRRQVYLYSEDAGTTVCISCDPAGQRPAGSVVRSDAVMSSQFDDDQAPAVAPDGTAVFATADQLVAEDVNGKYDVYEYDGERLHLISSGRAAGDSLLVGMAAGGRDVFFTTSQGLVGADRDGNVDIYVARRGGGFRDPDRPAEPSPCAGDSCQGRGSGLVGGPAIGSVGFGGRESRSSGRARVTGRLSVRGPVASLRVAVPGRGRITVSGPGLRSVSKAASRAGGYRLRLRLSKASALKLRRGERVRVRASVRFSPSAGDPSTQRLTLTFRSTTKRGR